MEFYFSNADHSPCLIRGVLIREIVYSNRSDEGALTQGILMTVFRSLKRRGYNPIATLVSALREFVRTGRLPPFPPVRTSEE